MVEVVAHELVVVLALVFVDDAPVAVAGVGDVAPAVVDVV